MPSGAARSEQRHPPEGISGNFVQKLPAFDQGKGQGWVGCLFFRLSPKGRQLTPLLFRQMIQQRIFGQNVQKLVRLPALQLFELNDADQMPHFHRPKSWCPSCIPLRLNRPSDPFMSGKKDYTSSLRSWITRRNCQPSKLISMRPNSCHDIS